MKISVITPSCRSNMLGIVYTSLKRQSFQTFEWIIVGDEKKLDNLVYLLDNDRYNFIQEPKKRKGDFYNLNKAYNEGIKKAKGELIVSYQDGIKIEPDCLERFWFHYQNDKKSCVGAVGDQYLSLDPPIKVWVDPRKRKDFGTFYECNPIDIEFTLCAIPKQAIYDAGALDLEFDRYVALSEKELNMRMDKLGYKFYLDQSIEYKALKHPRLNDKWDECYFKGLPYYERCLKEIRNGRRLKLDFLS